MIQERVLRPSPPPEGRQPRFVLTTSYHIFPLFARGCLFSNLTPATDEDGPLAGLLDLTPLPAPIPANWVAAVEDSARNAIPILLELKPDKNVASFFTLESTPMAAITISDIAAIVFRSSEELIRFRSWPFEDVDVRMAEVKWVSSPDHFHGPVIDIPPHGKLVNDQALGLIGRRIREADMFLGGVTYLLDTAVVDFAMIAGLEKLLNQDFSLLPDTTHIPRISVHQLAAATILTDPQSALSLLSTVDLDALLVSTTIQVLKDYPTRDGWPSNEVLDGVLEKASIYLPQYGLDSEEESLLAWYASCKRAIIEPPRTPLSDSGSLVRRAILLLMMRGTVDAINIGAEQESTKSLGIQVRGIAGDLAAMRTGLASSPTSQKGRGQVRADSLLGWLGKAFVSVVSGDSSLSDGPVEVGFRQTPREGGQWQFSAGDSAFYALKAELSRGLSKVAEDCRYYGYKVTVRDPTTLVVEGSTVQPLPGGVEVTLSEASTGMSDDEVRFTARGSTIGPSTGSKRGAALIAAAQRKITKQELWDLLIANATGLHNCRIGIDENTTELVVIANQILATMDRNECIAHLQNVAAVAETLRGES